MLLFWENGIKSLAGGFYHREWENCKKLEIEGQTVSKKKNGVFVGQFFCPKGFVLLGSQRVYWSIFFENCLEKWGAHYIRVHIIHK